MTNIGVFDSGLGGLTVLRELVKEKRANYYYLGDNKNIPYGNRTRKEIKDLSKKIVKFLDKKDIDFFIVACNTMSVLALDDLKKYFNKKFISISEAGVKEALNVDGDVFVMATKATCERHFYKEKIEENSNKKVYEVACKKLVDYIESGYIEGEKLDRDLKNYLKLANEKKTENIILACTHYPIIEDQIRKNLLYEANIIDPAKVLSENIKFKESKDTNIEIYMTDANDVTEKMVQKIMNMDISVKQANI
ncbi:glutamate racemase [Anaerococcus sp. AGMB00486]|uniref:Glutamate racemase n=2 Tax=Anaerococcus TaxID=165779 RepID=A0ABX2N863_9FIRM|nr:MULTISPECIES: glutamate racemase [Anaerococcus]MSS77356.1 glutamate racemase [Anaerococcus porci]NVF10843.1 glutamate racemase [Anaerococcus faecalis]